jgi:hypothetical protein
VQYAANACPAGSVYGHVKVLTPLLGYPLEGNIYLRSSSHQLPDVVAALRGPPSQPVAFDLDGQNGKTYDTKPAVKADFARRRARRRDRKPLHRIP